MLCDALSGRLLAQFDSVPSQTRSWLLRSLLMTILAGAILTSIGMGLKRSEAFVRSFNQYDRPLVLEWIDLPDWLHLPENGHILDSLIARVDLRPTDRLFDPTLASRLGAALAAPDVGWVKSVERIQVRPDAVVAVTCRYRRPRAWVIPGPSRKLCYLIDAEGIRLPGRYEAADCKPSGLMTITGVHGKPPEVGQKWSAPDLAAGLKLVTLLSPRPFQGEITAISVANHDGRNDKNRSHIELITDPKGPHIWWGRPPDAEHGIEISAAQKVTLLETLYRQWGHLSVNRPYIDIRTWPDRVAMPLLIPETLQPRILRG
jgi:hypothetical protein